MKKILLVYDDHRCPEPYIRSIIGEKKLGEVILKRKSVKENLMALVEEFSPLVYHISALHQLDKLKESLSIYPQEREIVVVHLFSYAVVTDEEEFRATLSKGQFVTKNYVLAVEQQPMGLFFDSVSSYLSHLSLHFTQLSDPNFYGSNPQWNTIALSCFRNISHYESFLQYISGGFDARFFNSVQGDDFTVVKSSRNKEKIKDEYQFYRFLPDHMKRWFVMPYHLVEEQDTASYTMERYHMTDLALRWIHSAISQEEFRNILTKAFQFLSEREEKSVSAEECHQVQDMLYQGKVQERIRQLKSHSDYPKLENLVSSGTEYHNLEQIVARYDSLYQKASKIRKKTSSLVLGHGDLCFSNMLFHKETELLKLIDPKGGSTKEALYCDCYYDVAKLSHSICGNYDFFNSGLFQVTLQQDLHYHLQIDSNHEGYTQIFREFLLEHGYDEYLLRVYEVSLFLSMLPLHMDKPLKVFGFILNAIKIMDEVEEK